MIGKDIRIESEEHHIIHIYKMIEGEREGGAFGEIIIMKCVKADGWRASRWNYGKLMFFFFRRRFVD